MNVIGENLLLIFVAAFFGQGKLGDGIKGKIIVLVLYMY